ncbi:Glycosyltransferase involved in cell wall bisynthesis [Dyadobacter sp. SG02]|uniref:glycosyltransferase family 2 protein n=1 Tax=Dyadobacter sp. SG02 TaxID=1855291 RepID=UPI0008B59036|nr:glycosyltransferase family 2 protein [Dyadobacter sp. SG02]SEJ77511.1 Glycosyltransferase involved in cell wall bisynthesis [Dyadobacter sp. SG02]
MNPARLLLVVPCYNEEAILYQTYAKLNTYYNGIKEQGLIAGDSRICFVNDGSRDKTWAIIEDICSKDSTIIGVGLSRNFGHQSAIMAGLEQHVNDFDSFITIDADLQDDINAITAMIEKHREGAMVVYGVRSDRSSDSWFKRFSAESFYVLMQKMGVPVVFNHADFRLMDQRVLKELGNFREINMFLRGVVPLIGFKNEKVYYSRLEREAGETKYPLSKMLLFAWNGITSFSTFPMRLVLYFGFVNFFIAMLMVVYILSSYVIGHTVAGWTSTMLPITFFSGFNMMALGLIGEYIGKIYEEVKGRPRYIIEKIVNE